MSSRAGDIHRNMAIDGRLPAACPAPSPNKLDEATVNAALLMGHFNGADCIPTFGPQIGATNTWLASVPMLQIK